MTRIAHLLNTRVQVWRTVRDADGSGGYVTELRHVGAEPARLSQPSSDEHRVGLADGARITQTVYLRTDADVVRGDELRAGGRALRVVATVSPSVPGTYLRADCTERQVEPGEDES